MARRSRRKGKSRKNTWISLGILVILVVSAFGFYAYSATNNKPASSVSTTSGSGSYAVLDTSQGTIVVELFPQVAPDTVSNFVSLADSGFYDNLVWHRILNPATNDGFGIIQTGDPNTKDAVNSNRNTWGQGLGPDTEPLETNANYLNDAGYLAIAHTSSSTSGGSQFYINVTNNTSLNGNYTVFGKVIEGMSVVDAISVLPVYTNSASYTYDQPIDAQNALLISVTIQSSP